jgi:antitoxin (DNA-binding transcriptional repressor) of toxin-antitoxin stability system
MPILRNLTLHHQGPEHIDLAARYGFALEAEPEGVDVAPGPDGLLEAAITLAHKLAECSQSGAAALIGGHTGLWIAALDRLAADHKPRPALCYFATRRTRDEHGRFDFQPQSLAVLPQTPSLPPSASLRLLCSILQSHLKDRNMPSKTLDVDVQEAQTRLSELLSLVNAGTEIILKDGNVQVARIVPATPAQARVSGLHPGAVWTAEDFDEPLPEEFWSAP